MSRARGRNHLGQFLPEGAGFLNGDRPRVTERDDRETGMTKEEYENNKLAFDTWRRLIA